MPTTFCIYLHSSCPEPCWLCTSTWAYICSQNNHWPCMAMIKPFNCLFSHVWCNQYSLAVNSLPCKTQKPLITSGRRRLNRRRKRTWRACLSVTRTFMPTKSLQYTVLRLHSLYATHICPNCPNKSFSFAHGTNSACWKLIPAGWQLADEACCRIGILPATVGCSWALGSLAVGHRKQLQIAFFGCNDSCFTSNQFNDDVQKAIFNRNCLASQKDECSTSTEVNCWHWGFGWPLAAMNPVMASLFQALNV